MIFVRRVRHGSSSFQHDGDQGSDRWCNTGPRLDPHPAGRTRTRDALTDEDQQGPPQLRLVLDNGEVLEFLPAADPATDGLDVVLRLPAGRAFDLSRVLDSYTALVELGARASEVSGTEANLARGLRDAASAADGRQGAPSTGVKVDKLARLRAMAEMQAARPDLNHSSLIAVIDAAAAWLEQREDYNAAVLLDAVAGDGAGSQAYLTLIGYDRMPSRGGSS